MHKVDETFDSGPIYKQHKIDTDNNDKIEIVKFKIAKAILVLLQSFLEDKLSNKIELYPQDEKDMTYYSYKDINNFIVNNKTPHNKWMFCFFICVMVK